MLYLFLLKIIVTFITIIFILVSHVNAETKRYLIDSPDFCVKVEKVEENRVYLVHIKENCIQAIGKVQVEVENGYKSVFIYVDGAFWKEQVLQEFNFDTVRQQMELNEKLKNNIKIPDNIYKEKGVEEAQKSASVFYSREFQKKINEETERLKQTVFSKPMETLKEYYNGADRANLVSGLADDERIYIFISSSVPLTTLRNYAVDIDKLGGKNVFMVMRGMKDGVRYIKPTIDFVSNILKRDQSCDTVKNECEIYNVEVQIDPLLFKRYNIHSVPAVVYATGVNVMDVQSSEGIPENAGVNDFYVIYGDMSLSYMLERINKEAKSRKIEDIIKSLQHGYYGR